MCGVDRFDSYILCIPPPPFMSRSASLLCSFLDDPNAFWVLVGSRHFFHAEHGRYSALLSEQKNFQDAKKGGETSRMVETARPTDPKKRRPEEEVVRRKEGTRISAEGGRNPEVGKRPDVVRWPKFPFSSPSPSYSLGGGDRRGRRESLRGKFARYYFGRPKREKGDGSPISWQRLKRKSGRTMGAASLSFLASAPFRHCPKLCLLPAAGLTSTAMNAKVTHATPNPYLPLKCEMPALSLCTYVGLSPSFALAPRGKREREDIWRRQAGNGRRKREGGEERRMLLEIPERNRWHL